MSDFVTKDSGERQEFATGMVRDTHDGKMRPDLIWLPGLIRHAELMARGAEKYGERNWEKAATEEERDRFKAAAFRHFLQWFAGERDEDHASAVKFNMDGAEYVEGRLEEAEESALEALMDDFDEHGPALGTAVGDVEAELLAGDGTAERLLNPAGDLPQVDIARVIRNLLPVQFRSAYPETQYHKPGSYQEIQSHPDNPPHFHEEPVDGAYGETVYVPRDHDTPHSPGSDCSNCVRLAATSEVFEPEDMSGTCWCLVDGDPDTCFKHSTDEAVD